MKNRREADLVSRGIVAVVIMWLVWACVCLVGAGVAAYVVWHFIQKFW